MSLSLTHALTDAELDRLEDFLYSDAVSEDSLDLIGVHGLFSALNISPKACPEAERLELIFDGTPKWASEQEEAELTTLLQRYYTQIGGDLYSDQPLELPCDLTLEPEQDEDISSLSWWAQAFMEGVFTNEEDWFNPGTEEDVAEMLLPIMVASDLFDESDILAIRKNSELSQQMCQEIPDLLVDLYLYFHSPEK
ncbi:YecA family protein [Pontibacter sp. JAM-7]|uniref:YecA/YgfB family protein n=1 Tax=Pontibacter sp. JAM-7 TaxID=3366581 RepID=UPI003AF603E9